MTQFATAKEELKQHLIDCIKDETINEENFEDAHHHAFNESHYIIGYHQASEWLKKHDICPFQAISACIVYEQDNFGEVHKTYSDSETTVNMLAYVLGQEITPYADTWEEFKEELGI